MPKFTRSIRFWLCLFLALGFAIATPSYAKKKEKEETTETDEKKWAPPGLQRQGKVPPGLEKKGGLPPGQAKKYGVETPTEKKDADKEKEKERAEKESKEKKAETERAGSPREHRRGPFGLWGKGRTAEEQAKTAKEGTDAKVTKPEAAKTTPAPAPKEAAGAQDKKPEQEKVTTHGKERRGPFGLWGKRRTAEEQARMEKEAKERAEKEAKEKAAKQ